MCRTLQSRIKGYIYGSALGDALGSHLEHYNIEYIRKTYGEYGLLELPTDSFWTDDTEMMMAIARALIKGSEFDTEILMDFIAEEFVECMKNDRCIFGGTCKASITLLKNGVHWGESGLIRSKGSGSVMRSGIIGLFYQHDLDKLIQVASISGRITHKHPTADAASIAGAYAVKLCLDGLEPEKMRNLLLEICAPISSEFGETVSKAYSLANSDLTDKEAMIIIGEGWTAEEAFSLAYFLLMRYPEDYKTATQVAVNINGDSDTVGAITGGLIGSRLGEACIPTNWRNNLRDRELLFDLITDIVHEL